MLCTAEVLREVGNSCFTSLRTPRRNCSVCGGVSNSTLGRRNVSPSRCYYSERQTADILLPGVKSLYFFLLCLGFGQRAPFLSVESSHFCVTVGALSLANPPWFSCLVLSHSDCESFYVPVPKLGCVPQYPAAFLLPCSRACFSNSAPGIRRIQRMLWKRE